MRLFRWLASSRVRLTIAVFIGLGACVLLASPAADFIRYRSSSPATNLVIKTGFAFLILGTATLLAILVGDRVFAGRWRERVILGEHVVPDAPSESLEALKGMKSYFLHFSVLVAVFTMGGGIAIDGATRIFSDSDYNRTTMRGDAVERKLAILVELGGARTEEDVAEAVELIDVVWRDGRQPLEVRVASLEALGEIVDYLVTSVEAWRREGRIQSWQADSLVALRQTLAGELRTFHPTAPPGMRAHVTYVLGGMQDVRAADLLVAELTAYPDPASDEWLSAIVALGSSRQATALPHVAAHLDAAHADPAYMAVAWATQELVRAFYSAWPNPEDARDVPEGLVEAVARVTAFYGAELNAATPARRCVAVEVLRFTGHLDAREPLMAAFDAPETAGVFCSQVKVEVAGGVPGWIGAIDESLRARIVQALATISQGDGELAAWLRERLARGGQDEDVTVLLQQLTGARP